MRKILVIFLVGLLVGCAEINNLLPENRVVSAKCTNIDALISKNITAGMSADLPVVAGGVVYKSKSPEISGIQATILTQTNQACRAWALGAMSNEKWETFLDQRLAASIALSGIEDASMLKKTIAGVLVNGSANEENDPPEALVGKIENIMEERARFQEQGLTDIRDAMERQYAQVREAIDNSLSRFDRFSSETSSQLVMIHAALDNIPNRGVPLDQSSLNRIREIRQLLEAHTGDNNDIRYGQLLDELEKIKNRGQGQYLGGSAHQPGDQLSERDRTILSALSEWVKKHQVTSESSSTAQEPFNSLQVSIHFGVGDGEMTFDGVERLNSLLLGLSGRTVQVEIEGFSDINGQDARNLALSEARAKVVANIITNYGIAVSKVTGKGATDKFGPLHSQNRVVVVHFQLADH